MENIDLGRKKNLILNLVVVAAAFAVAFNIYTRQSGDVVSLKAAKETERRKNALLESIKDLEHKFDAYSEFMGKRDTGYIIDHLNSLTHNLQIKILSIKPQAEQKFASYIKSSYVMTVNVSGYHDLGVLISRIESSAEIFTVSDVEIRPAVAQGKGLEATMKVVSIVLIKE